MLSDCLTNFGNFWSQKVQKSEPKWAICNRSGRIQKLPQNCLFLRSGCCNLGFNKQENNSEWLLNKFWDFWVSKCPKKWAVLAFYERYGRNSKITTKFSF